MNQDFSMRGPNKHFYIKGILVLKPNHKDVLSLESMEIKNTHLGSRVWSSSYLLIHYLAELKSFKHRKVLEIGCGWGLPSTFVKKRFNADVITTDKDGHVQKYQQLLSSVNNVDVQFQQKGFHDLTINELLYADLIMGADICYSLENIASLHDLIQRYFSNKNGEMLICDSGYPAFFDLIERLGNSFNTELTKVSMAKPTGATGYVLRVRNMV